MSFVDDAVLRWFRHVHYLRAERVGDDFRICEGPSERRGPGRRYPARHTQTGVVVSTLSGDDGYYRLQNLLPGEHVIQIGGPGFRAFISSPQAVSVAERTYRSRRVAGRARIISADSAGQVQVVGHA